MKNIIENFDDFLNEELLSPESLKNVFSKNKTLKIRVKNLPMKSYTKTDDPEDLELEFDKLINLGRGRWKIEFKDHSMEYGYGNITYDSVSNEIEDIDRFGYEKKQEPHNLITDDNTIKDIKKIIRKNK